MLQNIKISIITVCLNSIKTIEQTIQSVIGQSYKNIEYIIIDGGSTDGTLDIIRKYESHLAYWVSEPDNGIYDAMNKGVTYATGDLVAFMNSDDWYADDAVEHAVKVFDNTGADVLYGDVVVVDGDTQKIVSTQGIDLRMLHYFGVGIYHQTMFVKTDWQQKIRFDWAYRIAADFKCLLELYMQGARFQYIGEIIAFYRLGGLSSSSFWLFYKEIKDIVNVHLYSDSILWNQYATKAKRRLEELRMIALTDYLYKRFSQKVRCIKKTNEIAGRGYILFGAGNMGKRWVAVMIALGLQIKGIWSNDDNQVGQIWCGKLIEKPNFATKNCVLIATCPYEKEIAEQLEENGMKRGEDYFGYRECLKWAARVWLGKASK